MRRARRATCNAVAVARVLDRPSGPVGRISVRIVVRWGHRRLINSLSGAAHESIHAARRSCSNNSSDATSSCLPGEYAAYASA